MTDKWKELEDWIKEESPKRKYALEAYGMELVLEHMKKIDEKNEKTKQTE